MRVLFDGHWWIAGPTSNREVLKEIIWAWAESYPADDIAVAVRSKDAPLIADELGPKVELRKTHIPRQGFSSMLELPRIARAVRADVIVAHNFAPLRGNSVVFIHDVLFQSNPEWFTKLERAYFSLMPISSHRARLIFTSTYSEAERIKAQNPSLPQARAVGLGLSRALTNAIPVKPRLPIEPFSFALCVGRLNVRKNLRSTLVGAVESAAFTPESPLVVVGEKSGKSSELPQAVKDAISLGAIVFAGYLTNAELAWMYRHTRSVIFLTLGEGFGLPALEAIWFGAPLLVSDIRVMHEVCANHAEFADPTDVGAIASAINALPTRTVSVDSSSGQNYVTQRFGWPRLVRQMREEIERTPLLTRTISGGSGELR